MYRIGGVAPGEEGEWSKKDCLECVAEEREASLSSSEAEPGATDHRCNAAPETRVNEMK